MFLASIALSQDDPQGPVWFVEAMFPGYPFTKFVYSKQHRAVEASHGVRGIVRFGDRPGDPTRKFVAGLQSRVGAEEVVTIDSSIKIGDAVEIIEGPFRGLEVLVTQVLPAKERVRVLLSFLGDPSKWKFRQQKCLPPKRLLK